MPRASFVLGALRRDLRRTGLAGAAAVALTALAVVVIGLVQVGHEALARLVAGWRAELRIVAFLRDQPARPAGLVAAVRALPGVGAVRYVSAADALAELTRDLGDAAAGLERLPVNPVAARLEVVPGGGAGAAEVDALVGALRQTPGVDAVEAATAWVEPAERVERGVRVGGLALGLALALLASGAIGAATTIAAARRADETAILRLAGVPERRVRGPLLGQSLLLGAAGAALGCSLLWLCSEAAAPWTGVYLRALLGLGPLPMPDWPVAASLLGAGLLAGFAGGVGAARP